MILIFGGSGSLGNALIKRYLQNNKITIASRDECKHWEMNLKYKSKNLFFEICDIRDKQKVKKTILKVKPEIIIIAAALKHIDKCEYDTHECILTNLIGTKNIIDSIEEELNKMEFLKKVCFVSTDKACSPINTYGLCKGLSEKLIIEKALYLPQIKFICVRYGNVLNSRGSIIPILHNIGKNPEYDSFTLTDERMTRFVMTLEQSVDLIDHALNDGNSGDIVIPELISMKVKDLIEIFSEIYNKPIIFGKIRPGEKMLESLINESQSMRMIKGNHYYYIKPEYSGILYNDEPLDYNSTICPLNKEQLRNYLKELDLI